MVVGNLYRNIDPQTLSSQLPNNGPFRVEIDGQTGDIWICMPGYQRLCRLLGRVSDPKLSLYAAWYDAERDQIRVERRGRARALWD